MRPDPRPVGEGTQQLVSELMNMPGDEGQRQIAEWVDALFAHRRLHPTEGYRDGDVRSPEGMTDDAAKLVSHVTHLWTSMDIRDRAQAIEKALTAEYEGSHPLFICDSHNALGVASQALAELCYPLARVDRPFEGTESLVSMDKARSLIGYEPEHSVSRYW